MVGYKIEAKHLPGSDKVTYKQKLIHHKATLDELNDQLSHVLRSVFLQD